MTDSGTNDSAGIIVFRNHGEELQVLMIRYGQNHFSFPKGHIESGESKEDAALRETLEETGVCASIIPDFCYPVSSSKPGDCRLVFFFSGVYKFGEPKPQQGETSDVFWMPVSNVPEKITFSQDRDAFGAALDMFVRRFNSSVDPSAPLRRSRLSDKHQ